MREDRYWEPSVDCKVCGRLSVAGSYLCGRCRRLLDRIEIRRTSEGAARRVNRRARLEAMRKQWDQNAGAFRCHYTGVTLTEGYPSRRYATWEHVTPGDERSVVLVADLVNKMKGDMTEKEFRLMVQALARHFDESGSFDEAAFPQDRPRQARTEPDAF